MIKPCIVHSAAKVHYHQYSIVYVRKFTFESSVILAQILFVYWLPILASMSVIRGFPGLGSGLLNARAGFREITKCPKVKRKLSRKKIIIIWHHHISTLFSSTLLVRSLTTPSDSGPQQCGSSL